MVVIKDVISGKQTYKDKEQKIVAMLRFVMWNIELAL